MQLYLLRHADAETPAVNDDERALSEKGVAQAKQVARFCHRVPVRAAAVLTSPLRRTQETARIVATQLRVDLIIAPWLASGMQATAALEELRALKAVDSVMLVGHEPDFSELIAHLIGLQTATAIHITKASLTSLEIAVFNAGTARLEFSIPCKLM